VVFPTSILHAFLFPHPVPFPLSFHFSLVKLSLIFILKSNKWKVTRRRGRRRKKLLDDLKDRRGYSHLKEEALDRTIWRNRFGRGVGPVIRQNTEWMNYSWEKRNSARQTRNSFWATGLRCPCSLFRIVLRKRLRQFTHRTGVWVSPADGPDSVEKIKIFWLLRGSRIVQHVV
jgi:hypothetical protein